MMRITLALAAAGGLALLAIPAGTTASQTGKAPAGPGEQAFQKCYACHSLDGTDKGVPGPSLKGIIGRPVASRVGYDYSPAMREYAAREPRWTRATLDAFLANPQGVVPDNEMGFFSIRDPKERAALIDYLAAH